MKIRFKKVLGVSNVTRRLLLPETGIVLSPREVNVLELLAANASNRAIAALPAAAAPPAPLVAASLTPNTPAAASGPAARANPARNRVPSVALQTAAPEAVAATWSSLGQVLAVLMAMTVIGRRRSTRPR